MKRILLILSLLLLGTTAHAQTIMQWAGADPVIGPSYRTTSTPVLGGELVTGWTNSGINPFESFATSGVSFTVLNNILYGIAVANTINPTVGVIYKTSADYTRHSGTNVYRMMGFVSTAEGGAPTAPTFPLGSFSASQAVVGYTIPDNASEDYLIVSSDTATTIGFTLNNTSVRPVSLSSLLAPTRPFQLGTSGGRFYWTPTTANCDAGQWLGAWVCSDDLRNPTTGLWAFVNRTTGYFELRAVTAVSSAGAITSTSLINTAITFSSGAQALLVVDTSNTAAPFAQCFYNNAAVGAKIDLTAYASWINANRRHAIFSTTAVTPGSVTYDFGQMVLQADLFDPGAGTFSGVSTYAWVKFGNNTIANDTNSLKITYVDNANGAYTYLRDTYDLVSDLVVGALYRFDSTAAVNAGSTISVQIDNGGVKGGVDSVTEISSTAKSFYFVAQHSTNNILTTPGMAAGEIIWLDNLVLRRIQ